MDEFKRKEQAKKREKTEGVLDEEESEEPIGKELMEMTLVEYDQAIKNHGWDRVVKPKSWSERFQDQYSEYASCI